jgi:ankyrin repeat protein
VVIDKHLLRMSSDRGIGSDSAFFGDSLCTSSDTCPCKQSSYHASIWTACASNDFLLVANKINLQPRLVNTLDRFGYSPLHYAAQGNHADIVRLLLFHGADPNGCASLGSGYVTNKESAKRSVLGKDPRPCGATPLHRAGEPCIA